MGAPAQLIWRFNIYTDPRKPVSVDTGVRVFGSPKKDAPVLITTNYALTYFTVESDIKAAGIDCFLIVIDTGETAWRAQSPDLNAESIAAALKDTGIAERVNYRYLIIPGLAAA